MIPADINEQLEPVFRTLTYREREVFRTLGGYGREVKTLEEVAKQFQVTPERCKQIEAKAYRKLQHPVRLKLLPKGFAFAAPKTIDNMRIGKQDAYCPKCECNFGTFKQGATPAECTLQCGHCGHTAPIQEFVSPEKWQDLLQHLIEAK